MKNSEQKIRKIELEDDGAEVRCPVCNQVVIPALVEGDLSPCPHTLFIAHDEGFEFRDERFDEAMKIGGIDSLDLELGDDSIDEFTDKVPLADTVKYATYVSAPSGFGSYIGFQLNQIPKVK